METFEQYFKKLSSHDQPHSWQSNLAKQQKCDNCLIRIPTGFGKTQGVIAAWVWNRIIRQDECWPRRLVWCLPMRVLVEQTEFEVSNALKRLDLLWTDGEDHAGKIGVHLLMGGADSGDWHLYPEECAVLIGTQDMLLSRAMNRGYASPRARWPMEFGLLNQDALWVMDEVQLMDVGLATSGQLQAFRKQDKSKAIRQCHTWWMSATLQRGWLGKSPETSGMAENLPQKEIAAANRNGHLWDDVRKPCEVKLVKDAKELARLVAAEHLSGGCGASGPTLVVMNTVDLAVKVYEALQKEKSINGTDPCLIHSRFRPAERASWRTDFLNREACSPGTDRIIVATQVVEAGVDISAGLLITELAPWASLVQRFGRCARWGGTARVIVADLHYKDDKKAAPYTLMELDASREALNLLVSSSPRWSEEFPGEHNGQDNKADVAPLHLESFEENHPDLLPRLYPYEPRHLLLRHELEELFDTSSDLTGADIDISRFIRSGEERDLHVFWVDVPEKTDPASSLRPSRESLCSVPFLKARDWLCGVETASKKAPRLKVGIHAWVWDWLDGIWRRAERRDLYPGQTVLVSSSSGGYLTDVGWTQESNEPVAPILAAIIPPDELADSGQDDETLSALQEWRTIATHGLETAALARKIAETLATGLVGLFDLAARWHDAGKAFPAFQGSIKSGDGRPERQDLAKAPKEFWLKGKNLYPMSDGSHRPGFRHELASTLALFAVLQRHNPDHPALLGPWRNLLNQAGFAVPPPPESKAPTLLEKEILTTDTESFNLLIYLICAHHGKIRLAWHSCPADQKAADEVPRIRGLRKGDTLPAMTLFTVGGEPCCLPGSRLDLTPAGAGLNPHTGPGWTERVLDLLSRHGPFVLAWLEALLRAADQRASRDIVTHDSLLEEKHGDHRLEGCNTDLAKDAGSSKACHPLAEDTAQCRPEYGLRGGTSGSGAPGSGTCPPTHATRYIETRLGILTYAELAPHLARNVQTLEERIEAGEFDTETLGDHLINTLHSLICGDLTLQLTGWRDRDVCVGQHTAPSFPNVPVLMREYSRDLQTRLQVVAQDPDELLLETLAFAEGRLLSIHPFADFNGRVTRVFLRLLLRRIDLPSGDLLPPPEAWNDYLAALRAADHLDWQPLMAVWRQRFENEGLI